MTDLIIKNEERYQLFFIEPLRAIILIFGSLLIIDIIVLRLTKGRVGFHLYKIGRAIILLLVIIFSHSFIIRVEKNYIEIPTGGLFLSYIITICFFCSATFILVKHIMKNPNIYKWTRWWTSFLLVFLCITWILQWQAPIYNLLCIFIFSRYLWKALYHYCGVPYIFENYNIFENWFLNFVKLTQGNNKKKDTDYIHITRELEIASARDIMIVHDLFPIYTRLDAALPAWNLSEPDDKVLMFINTNILENSPYCDVNLYPDKNLTHIYCASKREIYINDFFDIAYLTTKKTETNPTLGNIYQIPPDYPTRAFPLINFANMDIKYAIISIDDVETYFIDFCSDVCAMLYRTVDSLKLNASVYAKSV